MLPGMGGMDPRAMARAMSQMGIKTEELAAKRVTIELDDSQIVVQNPKITKITMQGQVSFQIAGDIVEKSSISDADVQMVAQTAGVDKEKARKALEEASGDIAEAIMKLQEEK
ncbi:MAG: nascent polypeptide-associated complex protein [Candidatus Micrarchaeota archaeon]